MPKADMIPLIDVGFDWDKNGGYSNVTADVLSFSTKQGFEEEYQTIASPGNCTIVLDNTGYKYSPLFNFSPGDFRADIKPYVPVRIQVTYPGGTYTPSSNTGVYGDFSTTQSRVLFVGEAIEYTEKSYDNNTTVMEIQCQDFVARFQDSGFKFPPIYLIPPHTPIQIIVDEEFGGERARGYWYFKSQPVAGLDHLSLLYGAADPIVYPFVNTITGANNEIKIGATLQETIFNAYCAINGAFGSGTRYSSNTAKPPFCSVKYYQAPFAFNYQEFILEVVPAFTGTQGNTILMGVANLDRIWVSNSSYGFSVQHSDIFYSLDDAGGSTTIRDDGWNDNSIVLTTGTFNVGVTSATGKYNKAIYIPAGQYARHNVNNAIYTDRFQDFSCSFWVKPPSGTTNSFLWDWVIVDSIIGTRRFVVETQGSGANDRLVVTTWDSLWFGSYSSTVWKRNDWNHIAFVYDAGVFKLYCNGVLQTTITDATPTFFSNITNSYVTFGADFVGNRQNNLYFSDYKFQASTINYNNVNTSFNQTIVNLLYAYGSVDNRSGFVQFGTTGTTNGITPYISVNSENYFGYIGDDWVEQETAKYDAIGEIALAELGRFFQSRNGQLIYWSNKDYLKRINSINVDNNPVPKFSPKSRVSFEINSKKQRIYNSVNVTFTPRIISNAIVEVAKNGVIQVPGRSGYERWNEEIARSNDNGVATLKMDFINPDTNNKCGAYYIESPLIGGVHWYANESRDGTGVDYTNFNPPQLDFSLVHNTSGAEISIRNIAMGYLWVYDIKLRGKMITKENPITYTVEDQTSIDNYRGKKVYNFQMPLDVNPVFAKEVANWLLSKFKEPAFTIPNDVNFRNAYLTESPTSATAKHILDIEIMDELDLTSTQFHNLKRYFVSQIMYDWKPGLLSMKMKVESAENTGYFILDNASFGILDTNRVGI